MIQDSVYLLDKVLCDGVISFDAQLKRGIIRWENAMSLQNIIVSQTGGVVAVPRRNRFASSEMYQCHHGETQDWGHRHERCAFRVVPGEGNRFCYDHEDEGTSVVEVTH